MLLRKERQTRLDTAGNIVTMSAPRYPSLRAMARGVFVCEHSQAPLILESLRPDNTRDICMEAREDCVVIRVAPQSLRTFLATCDDLLVNLQVAAEALADV